MKHTYLLILAIFCFSGPSANGQIKDIDITDTGSIAFQKNATATRIDFFSRDTAIMQAFGQPDSTASEYSEEEGLTYTKWTYQGVHIYLHDGELSSLDIEDPSVGLIFKNQTIRVGSDINILASLFPKSFSARENGQLFVGLRYEDVITDAHIVIGYDRGNKITYIHGG
jgi:hypothetical protein